MKNKIFLLSCFWLLVLTAQGQSEFANKHAFHVAYLGEMLTHPGISVGYEKYLTEDEKFHIFVRPTAAFYHHYRNNTTFMLTLESGFRRNFRSGFFLEQSLGVGYFQRLVHGDGQFYVAENGTIMEKGALGVSFLPLLANVGIGYHFQSRKVQISPFVRPNFYWKMPFNETPNMQLAIMAGIIYRIKN
jgi:hypothetical protein